MSQIALFATERQLPEGFVLQAAFIAIEEELRLIEFIRTLPFGEVRMHGIVARRRIAHFGLRYAFSSHALSPGPEIPHEFRSLRDRTAAFAGIEPESFSELLVTEYAPGAGIGWHRDAPPFGIVAGVSLASSCEMRFRRQTENGTDKTAVEVPARSVYLLTGAARADWQHSIPPMRKLRYSLTFRTLKNG